MSLSATPFSSASGPAAGRLPAPVTLVLDAKGVVRSAVAAAGPLWQVDPVQLLGRPFASLFAFEVVSADPEFLDAQWEAIVSSATEHTLALSLQPVGGESRPARVRLEPGAGGDFFATISPPLPKNVPASGSSQPPFGAELLSSSTALGFFDLNFATGEAQLSATWKRLFGYAEHELESSYTTWQRLLHPDDSAAAPDQAGRHPAPGERRSFTAEFRMKHRRGHWLWMQGSGVRAFDQTGRLARVAGVLLDITERKEAEEQGLVAEDRLNRLTAEGALALFDLDVVHDRMAVSPAWERLLGAPPLTPADLAAQFGAADVAALLERLCPPGDAATWAQRMEMLRPATGSARTVLLALHRQFSRRGELLRVVGVALPTAASGTHPAAELLEATLDSLNEAVIVTDNRGHVVYLNPKARRLTGATFAGDRPPKLREVFQLVTSADGRPADDAVDLALATEQQPRMNDSHALVRTGGTALPIVWTASEARGSDGQVAGIVIVFRDPQEMSLTPEELIRANRFESLGQLAGGIAHDFNNLLTTILGGISIAKENRDASHLADAEAACMAAKALTRQLLAFAKGTGGGARQAVRPAEIMRDAVRVAAAGATARIVLDLDDTAGPVEVDRGQMLQVFQNLIINALQALPDQSQGVIHLRCRALQLSADQIPPLPAGDYVQLEVQDNGTGITPENLDRIFDPFFTTKKHGTGLGLATVLAIVRKHGGQLGVESVVGTGTTFSAFLPVTERTVESNVRRAPMLRFGTGRILFMDDDPKITELTAGMLEGLDYTHDSARNGEEAIALYRRYLNIGRPYDAVILDLTIIGGMGGEECFKRLRELDPEVRAIVSSGYDNDDLARHYLDMGFVGYLTKPYRVTDLGRILKSVLGR